MTSTAKVAPPPFTHVAYLFIRIGVRRGRVYGYWKDGGRGREGKEGEDIEWFSVIDMLPRGGWDGRIKYIPIGEPPPVNEPIDPQRPSETGVIDGEDDHSDV
jgi:hypothetical protein